MTNKEIREKSVEELQALELEMRQKLFALRFQNYNGQLETPSNIKSTQKLIARILTIIKEKNSQEIISDIKANSKFLKTAKKESKELEKVSTKKTLIKAKEAKVEKMLNKFIYQGGNYE